MTDFSETSILSNEFVVIGRASTDNLSVLLGLRAKCGPCGKKCLKKSKSERNNVELGPNVATLLISSQSVAFLETFFGIRSSNLFCQSVP